MASSNTVSSTLPTRDYHCKVCDLYLDSVDSLEVHLKYHKENLYVKWGTQINHNDRENNNATRIKNETTITAPADSSDNMITKPSPEFQQRATPETSNQFTHPATPQSYHSAPSPYQNTDQTSFSPSTQFNSSQFTHGSFQQNQHPEHMGWEQSQYNPDFHKPSRFHPYSMQDRVSQVSSSSPLYSQPLNQPTPSPSPNQCDKCGFVCDSAMQLNEHCNTAHGNTTPQQFQQLQFQPKQYSSFGSEPPKVKEEHEESSDILDLDSQKVVYQGNESDSQGNPAFEPSTLSGRDIAPRNVPSMLSWETQKMYNQSSLNGDANIYKDQKQFTTDVKMFHPEQKFAYSQEKNFLPSHHDPKAFLHTEHKIYSAVPMPPLTDYATTVAVTNPDMKPPYRPYDSPAPQISSTQSANPTSTVLPSIGGKGANWKSNEARRPKTYNCTACNKWFTSSGHLKRHYNTTLHKNAVRSSGQPDPATMPISSHHHPARDSHGNRTQQSSADSNTHSPGSGDDGRGGDDSIQSPYASQNFDRSHRATSLQNKSPYSQLQQGNVDNNFMSNNPLVNQSLSHQLGSHPLNMGSPPGIGNPDSTQGSKQSINSTAGNPPNGEAGPSVSQNHHLRGLLSVSTSNISAPTLAQNSQITPHTLPPFSHLAVNPYSPRPSDPLPPTIPDPTHTPLYLGQNFQQSIAPNYPNEMAPHVMDMATSNLHIANPATFGEQVSESTGIVKNETNFATDNGRLPSFSQIQSQRFGVFVPNYITSPNVGGSHSREESNDNFVIIESSNCALQYTDSTYEQKNEIEYMNLKNSTPKLPQFVDRSCQLKEISFIGYAFGGRESEQKAIVPKVGTEIHVMKLEDIIDYANKENFESEMKSPASPESARVEYESSGSPSVSSTVGGTPLIESNKVITKSSIHKCFECDKVFNKACYLTQHNKSFHSGAKPFKCERCGKRFSDDASYEGHCSKHAGIKPFMCQQCPKSFNHKTDLRRHMCLHSGTKPYACQHCGKGFIRKDHMVKHCETHRKKNPRSSP